jgi:hypothetical protein
MFNFLGFTFLNGAMLIGTAAMAIPLIIHLSRSRRTKKMRFSTTQFFTDQFLRSYRMSKLKELLLLACRMALCFFLAFAFAKPLFATESDSFLSSGSRSVVLVIDNSASMGYKENGRSLLDRARETAEELLGDLGPGDTVSVVLAGYQSGGPKVVCENKPHNEIGDVFQELKLVTAGTQSADLTEAVARAEQIAQGSEAPNKEVYVLSDLQDSGWDRDNEHLKERQSSDVLFFFVHLRPKKVSNVAVTAIQYAAPRPIPGIPFTIRPLVASQGEQSQNAMVRLYVYDENGEAKKVSERPLEKRRQGGWQAPRFSHTFRTGGWHGGYVEVDDENLPQDNRRYFALQVLDSIQVLAINGVQSAVRDLDRDPVFFLRAALLAANSQVERRGGQGGKAVEVKVDNPDLLTRISPVKLRAYPLVVLANVPRLSPTAVKNLEDYIDGGGSLLVFLGDTVDAKFYNNTLAGTTRRHGGLLPATLDTQNGPRGARGKKQDSNVAAVASLDYNHPALALFEDSKNGTLAGINFKALWEVKPQADQAAVLMFARRLGPAGKGKSKLGSRADGEGHLPLLCEKQFGKGRVLLFASTCSRSWTNFPTSSSFLVWTHQLVSYLAQKPLGRQGFVTTGDPVPVPVSVTEGMPPVQVLKPDRKTRGYASMSSDPENPLVFTDTVQAGVYTLNPDDKKQKQLLAVNLDPYESKLTYLDDVFLRQFEGDQGTGDEKKIEAGFKEVLPQRGAVVYVSHPSRIREVATGARRGIKLWDIVLWGVLVLVLFEPWLANRISVRHYAQPKAVTPDSVPREGRWGRVPAPEGVPAGQEVAS